MFQQHPHAISQVFVQQISRTNGRLVSAQVQGERFDGEYVVYESQNFARTYPPTYFENKTGEDSKSQDAKAKMSDLAERYGYGTNTGARPVGTAILVGNKGTIVEIVLYKVANDLQSGDGIARDNKGHYYRVFLSAYAYEEKSTDRLDEPKPAPR